VSWLSAGGFRTQFDFEMNATEFKDAFDPSVRFIATDQITGIYSFLQALDWTEAWPYFCIAFHVTLFMVITSLRHHSTVQGVLFLGMLLAVYMAEYVNEILSQHHRIFTKHQYFDSNGLFISIVVSLPMLLNCTTILVSWIWMSVRLLKEHKVQRSSRASERRKDDEQIKDKRD